MDRFFIITMDTEGDNLWNHKDGDTIKTENVLYLQRFQSLCEKYGFKPVWLSNYEMMCDSRYVEFIKDVVARDAGECGMHLHSWNNPPVIGLKGHYTSLPYLIEYDKDVMCEKIFFLTSLIEKEIGKRPISHRAGRWATNDIYLNILRKKGFLVDCSFTPYINWESSTGRTFGSKGSDYSNVKPSSYVLENGLLEVPVTTKFAHKFFLPDSFSIKGLFKQIFYFIKGYTYWLRPNGHNLKQMKWIIRQNRDKDYVMFMLHSSELMPGGSPNFKTEKDIEKLYSDLDSLFSYASKTRKGITLENYYNYFFRR